MPNLWPTSSLLSSTSSPEQAERTQKGRDQAAVEVSMHIKKKENQLSSLLGLLEMSGHALRALLRKVWCTTNVTEPFPHTSCPCLQQDWFAALQLKCKGDHGAAQYFLTLIKLQRAWKHACLLLVHAAKWLCHDCWRCWQEQSLYKEPLLPSQHRCNVLLLYSLR